MHIRMRKMDDTEDVLAAVACAAAVSAVTITHQRDIPAWAEACKNVLLIQPSSAAAERAFSF